MKLVLDHGFTVTKICREEATKCICMKLSFFVCLSGILHLFSFFLHLIPFGKFGPPYLSKVTAAARAILPSPTGACWVFLCFHNPPNSDMDNRIFNVRKWLFSSTENLLKPVCTSVLVYVLSCLLPLECTRCPVSGGWGEAWLLQNRQHWGYAGQHSHLQTLQSWQVRANLVPTVDIRLKEVSSSC